MTLSPVGRVAVVALIAIAATWNALLAAQMVALDYNDFGKIWWTARAFLAGTPPYAPNPATSMPGIDGELLNLNPPHVHLPLLPLAALPLPVAAAVWAAASLAALAVSARWIAAALGARVGLDRGLLLALYTLAFAGTGALVVTGQLTLLLLVPATAAWAAARRGDDVRAGAWLGLAGAIKPFLLLPALWWLVRDPKAAAVAAVTAAAPWLCGLAVFGPGAYADWARAIDTIAWAWLPMNASWVGWLARATGGGAPYFAPIATVSVPELVPVVVAGVVAAVTLARVRHAGADRAFLALWLAALLVFPLGWVYYAPLVAGPLAGHVRDAGLRAPLAAALALGAVPVAATFVGQPAAAATLTIGGVYTWALLLAWASALQRSSSDGSDRGGGSIGTTTSSVASP